MRSTPTGAPSSMMEHDDTHYISLALGDDGRPYVGTGAEGRVYTVDDAHPRRSSPTPTSARSAPCHGRQALRRHQRSRRCSTRSRRRRHRRGVDQQGARRRPSRATSGGSVWRATGAVELSTRTGNTRVPDATWSGWSAPLAAPGESRARRAFRAGPRALRARSGAHRLAGHAPVRHRQRAPSSPGRSRTPRTPHGRSKTALASLRGRARKPRRASSRSPGRSTTPTDELRYRLAISSMARPVRATSLAPTSRSPRPSSSGTPRAPRRARTVCASRPATRSPTRRIAR